MPARLGCITSHSFGDQAQAGCAPRFRRKLQPPPFTQVKRARDFYDDKRNGPVLERFFRNGQGFDLVAGLGHQHVRRIKKRRESDGIHDLRPPRLAHPKHALRLCCSGRGKAHGAGSANLVNTRGS